MTAELRVGVAGAGAMGIAHIERISQRIAGARVSAVIEPDPLRAARGSAAAPGSKSYADITAALEDAALDALLIAAPGQFHEPLLMAALDAKLPTLCEKPLTPDAEGARRVVDAEGDAGLIQVGFMRRFDREYQYLRDQIAKAPFGELLLLRCVHRNPAVPDSFDTDMLITESLVHEIDIVPWLAGSPIRNIEIRRLRRNRRSHADLNDPILAMLELQNGVVADVEVNVSMKFGYQVGTEAVFEEGIIRTGEPHGPRHWADGRVWVRGADGFVERFEEAYDRELQTWVRAATDGTIDGPSARDGYAAALATEAALKALRSGDRIAAHTPERVSA